MIIFRKFERAITVVRSGLMQDGISPIIGNINLLEAQCWRWYTSGDSGRDLFAADKWP